MFCENCGNAVRNGAKFCVHCGHRIEPMEDVQEVSEAQETAVTQEIPETPEAAATCEETIQQPETENNEPEQTAHTPMSTTKKLIIGAVAITAVVLLIVVLCKNFSLEKRLMGAVWWGDPKFSNDAYDYSDSEWFQEEYPRSPTKGYYVNGDCESLLFCEYGTIRRIRYATPGDYMSSHEVTADNYSGGYKWESSSDNSTTWTLLDGKKLSVGDEVYRWSSGESENTWYMTATTLRIGTQRYTKTKPRINNVLDAPPYWCAHCGEEGPFKSKCPECEHEEKIS